jgi:O-antigen/teichoic acid export membrane protein
VNFRSNAIAMLTGTVMAQALPLAASPLLTRLYSPEAFGLQTLFMGLAASLAVLATCRMDLAVVLPEQEAEAGSLAGFIFCTAIATAVLACLVVPLAGLLTAQSLPASWMLLLPLMVCTIALYQLSLGFASRRREFRKVAQASVGNQAAYVASAIALGFAGAWAQALAFAKVVGQLLGTGLLGRASAANLSAAARGFSWQRSVAAARKWSSTRPTAWWARWRVTHPSTPSRPWPRSAPRASSAWRAPCCWRPRCSHPTRSARSSSVKPWPSRARRGWSN